MRRVSVEQRQEGGDGPVASAARGSPRGGSSTRCVGACQSSSSASALRVDGGLELADVAPSARSDWLAAAKNALNATSSISTDAVVARDAARGRSRGARGGSRARACAGRRRRTRARWRGGGACRSGASGAARARWSRSAARSHHGIRIARERAHPRRGGVEPALPRVDERDRAASRRAAARGTASGGTRASFGASSATNASRSSSGSAAATRSTAIATSGGCVMHVVATSRGASGVASATARPVGCRRRASRRRRSCAGASRCPTDRGTARAARRPRAAGRSGRCRWR